MPVLSPEEVEAKVATISPETLAECLNKLSNGKKLSFQNRANRDFVYKWARFDGIKTFRGVSRNQLYDPRYTVEGSDILDKGIGNDYKHYFSALYMLGPNNYNTCQLGMNGLDPTLLNSLARLDLPAVPARLGWKLDKMAITSALDELNIELPVIIRFRDYKRHNHAGWLQYGVHRITKEYKVHSIQLNDTGLSATLASATLWHELAHAHQAEYTAKDSAGNLQPWDFYREFYLKNKGPHGATYKGNYFELEAERIANNHSHVMLTIEPRED